MESFTAQALLRELNALNITEELLPQQLVKVLTQKGLKVAAAESCTGGLISAKITEISGASMVFDCGVCSYSNDIKMKSLSVSKATLDAEGAVSESTAIQMAQGVRLLAAADIGISTTGIAGPTGGTENKPVGLVYIGCSTPKNSYAIRAEFCSDKQRNRNAVRQLATNTALLLALKSCNNYH